MMKKKNKVGEKDVGFVVFSLVCKMHPFPPLLHPFPPLPQPGLPELSSDPCTSTFIVSALIHR